jgi:hypothetical protein
MNSLISRIKPPNRHEFPYSSAEMGWKIAAGAVGE